MQLLIIQTAFIGDAILATALLEKLHAGYPEAQLDLLVRRGNESLFHGHPFLREVLIWNKKGSKYRELARLLREIRRRRYDRVINLQRFGATGLLTMLSRAGETIGFRKNPFSFGFDRSLPHRIGDGTHEVDRNLQLIAHLTDTGRVRPRLYPSAADRAAVATDVPYVCFAPTSVWFTKQWPAGRWVELGRRLPNALDIHLLGGPGDREACRQILERLQRPGVRNRAGELSFLESAALMENARMNYVNDSAPLHLCSAVNAPVTAIFCSTVPEFGFTPLSERSIVWETDHQLSCRPCGLHGKRTCPEGHFRCSEIEVSVEEFENGI